MKKARPFGFAIYGPSYHANGIEWIWSEVHRTYIADPVGGQKPTTAGVAGSPVGAASQAPTPGPRGLDLPAIEAVLKTDEAFTTARATYKRVWDASYMTLRDELLRERLLDLVMPVEDVVRAAMIAAFRLGLQAAGSTR